MEYQYIELGQTEVLSSRGFTNPEYTRRDLGAMYYMLERLKQVMLQPITDQTKSPIYFEEESGHRNRILILDPEALLSCATPAVVGFFGQARDGVDHSPLMELDTRLVAQLNTFVGVLCYYTLYSPETGYGNLVVCRDMSVKESWRTNPAHVRAVTLSPKHYYSVRLHNGALPGGVVQGKTIQLHKTKYFDFTDAGNPWFGLRKFEPDYLV